MMFIPCDKEKKYIELTERDQIIKTYLESEIPNGKSYFCRYFNRGHCLFSAKECKFSHGAEDFVFNKAIHLEQRCATPLSKAKKNKRNGGVYKTPSKLETLKKRDPHHEEESKEQDLITESSIQPIEQKSLGLEKSYVAIYRYQLLQKEKGKIEKAYTQEEIDKNENGPILAEFRRNMLKEVAMGFYDLLFRELQTNVLKKTLVENFFANIGWTVLLPTVTDCQFTYERVYSSETFIVKLPKKDELFEMIEDNLISLITSLKLIDNLPISPTLLKNNYYKEITDKKPLEPTLLVVERNIGLSFDELLQQFQQSKKFKAKLAAALGQELSTWEDVVFFEAASNEWAQFCEKISQLVKKCMNESPLGMIRLKSFEKELIVECRNEIKRYNNNLAYIRKLIKHTALRNKIFVVHLRRTTFLLSLSKLKRTSSQELEEVLKRVHHNCKESNPFMGSKFNFPPFRPYEPNEGDLIMPTDPYPKEFLDKEIDMNKVVLVDNLKKLEQAKSLLSETKVIGVDLEGNLERDGMVETVQCAYGGKIFVFDIYFLRREAQNLKNEKAKATYQQTLKLLQEMMEDPTICKVFHDGRNDSLGLHSCIQSCLLNTFDVSANYKLISQLEVYSKYQKALALDEDKLYIQDIKKSEQLSEEKCEEILKNIEAAARSPSLNDVLEDYKASHGINGLKSIMKDRFWKLPRGYFLQRSIDTELLIYSARDVEDLEEVRAKMMKRLEVALKNTCNGVSYEMLMVLTTYVSHLYTNKGCIRFAELQ